MSAAAPVGEKQIDLVDVDMGVFSRLAILNDAVIDGVQHHQQAHRFQIFAQVLNIEAENAAFCVDIGLVGKYTHVYIDEIYLFFANGSGSGRGINNYSSEFLYKCWKRFRKYGATLTGITQNVEECLLSNTARMMFANSEFLLMLNQATTDREQLARLLGASDTQMSYVDNAPAGHGLIKVGGAIVPFANELPKNTELYRLMSTRPGED